MDWTTAPCNTATLRAATAELFARLQGTDHHDLVERLDLAAHQVCDGYETQTRMLGVLLAHTSDAASIDRHSRPAG